MRHIFINVIHQITAKSVKLIYRMRPDHKTSFIGKRISVIVNAAVDCKQEK